MRENRTLRLTVAGSWKRDHGCRTAVPRESDGITTGAYRARACRSYRSCAGGA